MTVPLGVLKAGDILFRPPLPAWKQDAIAALGNGNLNKVCQSDECTISLLLWNIGWLSQAPCNVAVLSGRAA